MNITFESRFGFFIQTNIVIIYYLDVESSVFTFFYVRAVKTGFTRDCQLQFLTVIYTKLQLWISRPKILRRNGLTEENIFHLKFTFCSLLLKTTQYKSFSQTIRRTNNPVKSLTQKVHRMDLWVLMPGPMPGPVMFKGRSVLTFSIYRKNIFKNLSKQCFSLTGDIAMSHSSTHLNLHLSVINQITPLTLVSVVPFFCTMFVFSHHLVSVSYQTLEPPLVLGAPPNGVPEDWKFQQRIKINDIYGKSAFVANYWLWQNIRAAQPALNAHYVLPFFTFAVDRDVNDVNEEFHFLFICCFHGLAPIMVWM